MIAKKDWKEGILRFFFPPHCAICGAVLPWGEQNKILCEACAAHTPFLSGERCRMCGREIDNDVLCQRCRYADFAFCAGAAVFSYAIMRQAIAWLKFQGYRNDAKAIGVLMAQYLQQQYPDWVEWTDAIAVVPLHPNKRKWRGFNQVSCLCEVLSKETNLPIWDNVLIRQVDTIPQNQLSQKQRRENLRHVFAVSQTYDVTDKHILLVDDIFTTGTTLQECSRTLLRAGAAEVRVFCLAVVSKCEKTQEIPDKKRQNLGDFMKLEK